jgi:hypothetical protein
MKTNNNNKINFNLKENQGALKGLMKFMKESRMRKV